MFTALLQSFQLFFPKLVRYAVTHVAGTRTNLATQILTDLGNNAQMTLRTAADAVLATLTLPTTSGSVSGADLTFGVFTDETNAAAGTVAHIRMETSLAAEVFRFLPADITISSTTIGAGDTVSCSSLVYTAPA